MVHWILAMPLLVLLAAGTAMANVAQAQGRRPDTAAPLAAHRAWWRAFTLGDIARLEVLSAPDVTLTMSSGLTLDRAGVLGDARQRGDSAGIRLVWSDEVVREWGASAVVTARFTETIAGSDLSYRFLGVLQRGPRGWRVVAAQSTALPAAAATVPVPAAVLRDYAGRYQVPGGPVLAMIVRDTVLGLVRRDGREEQLTAVAGAVFEVPSTRTRFAFERDSSGRVVGVTLLSPQRVTTWPRVP